MKKITIKYQRPTKKEHGFNKVYLNGDYIGYMMLDRNPQRAIGKNYYFTPESRYAQHVFGSSKKDVLTKLQISIDKQ